MAKGEGKEENEGVRTGAFRVCLHTEHGKHGFRRGDWSRNVLSDLMGGALDDCVYLSGEEFERW